MLESERGNLRNNCLNTEYKNKNLKKWLKNSHFKFLDSEVRKPEKINT
jgi:hypothetical protein